MSLLGSSFISDLFGSVLSDVYEPGRLIRVTKVRGAGGVLVNQYQDPVDIRVQVDRCDEAMRKQSGFTDTDVKLLVLQAGISSPAPTTDDVIEAKGERWNMYAVGEDPARAYWRGRGVRQSSTPATRGWLFEYGHWDDEGVWRDDLPWPEINPSLLATPIENWTPQDEAMATILAVIEANGGDMMDMTWSKAAEQLGAMIGIEIQPGTKASQIRTLINEKV